MAKTPIAEMPKVGGLERVLGLVDIGVARVLDRALEGHEVTKAEGAVLFRANGAELIALMLAADELRRQTVGDVLTYVTVRNINFTNICTMACRFCAYSRKPGAADAECLSTSEVADRAAEAWRHGCTEVCLQGGINPKLSAKYYTEMVASIKARVPEIHVHAFSPFEVLHGAKKARRSVRDWLLALRDAGLDSMPGTAAEIFDPEVRRQVAPKKMTGAQWLEVVRTAHGLGIPTTATIMYGHVDGPEHWASHLSLLRDLQRDTGGFTELVPLGFVHENTPLYRSGVARPGPSGIEDIKMHSVARLMLNDTIKNVQVSWVKMGPKLAQVCLNAGANDFGGTLEEERISSSAGASHGQYMAPAEFHRLARDLGRIPAQRSTNYEILRVFDGEV